MKLKIILEDAGTFESIHFTYHYDITWLERELISISGNEFVESSVFSVVAYCKKSKYTTLIEKQMYSIHTKGGRNGGKKKYV